jgi:hypothetical protein
MGKRIAGAVVTAGAFVMWSAANALAQTSTSYPPSPKPTTSVEAASGGGGEPTAFTGGRIGFAVLAIAVLLVVGIVASMIARRRSAGVNS